MENKKKTGKIFSVKTGYNPNSSSVGSQIPQFFYFCLGCGILSLLAMQGFEKVKSFIRKWKKNDENK